LGCGERSVGVFDSSHPPCCPRPSETAQDGHQHLPAGQLAGLGGVGQVDSPKSWMGEKAEPFRR